MTFPSKFINVNLPAYCSVISFRHLWAAFNYSCNKDTSPFHLHVYLWKMLFCALCLVEKTSFYRPWSLPYCTWLYVHFTLQALDKVEMWLEDIAPAAQGEHWWICGLTGRPYYLHYLFNQGCIKQGWDRLAKQSQDSTGSVSASCIVHTLHFIVPALSTLFALHLQSCSHCFWNAIWLVVTAEKGMPSFINMSVGLFISKTTFKKTGPSLRYRKEI